jgi:parallel beta-helix repeat protein
LASNKTPNLLLNEWSPQDRFRLTEINANFRTIDDKIGILTKNRFNVLSYGAKGDGVTDDTTAIQNALNACRDAGGGIVYFPKLPFKISNTLMVYSNTVIAGEGIIDATSVATDAFVIYGSNVQGNEGKNIRIEGITVLNAGRFGIQIYGVGYAYKPTNITIENVTTKNCTAGGIYINSATYIRISKCYNDGGYRAVGIESPKPTTPTTTLTDAERYSKYIIIEHCTSVNTTQFAYQTFYSDFISIIGCHADGSLTTSGDRSCVTIDRSNNVTVSGNVLRNAPGNAIFVTGSENVTIEGNSIYAPTTSNYGIQVYYNAETDEDVVIKESKNITVAANSIRGFNIGIIFNGVKVGSIVGNICTGQGSTNAIYLMADTRAGDNVIMTTDQITVVGNVSDKNINIQPGVVSPTIFIGNRVASIIGLTNTDIVLDNNYVRLGNKTLENVGLFKRTALPDDIWLAEFQLSGVTHKGMIQKYSYGKYVLADSAGVNQIAFHVGQGSGDNGNIELLRPGKGIIFVSPDGLTKKKLTIDNSGNAVWTTV